MRAAARQSDAESLLALSVQRVDDAMTVMFLYLDPNEAMPRTVKRRYTGERIGEQPTLGLPGSDIDSKPLRAPSSIRAEEA